MSLREVYRELGCERKCVARQLSCLEVWQVRLAQGEANEVE